MGEVYRARDPRLNRDVALKVLSAAIAGDTARRQRFEQEARAVAALNHPNIVAVYDVGDGYIVSEFIDGETLRGAGFPLRKTLDIAIQISAGLAAAHDAAKAYAIQWPSGEKTAPLSVKGVFTRGCAFGGVTRLIRRQSKRPDVASIAGPSASKSSALPSGDQLVGYLFWPSA
jgi:serine/threonine protein kinase